MGLLENAYSEMRGSLFIQLTEYADVTRDWSALHLHRVCRCDVNWSALHLH